MQTARIRPAASRTKPPTAMMMTRIHTATTAVMFAPPNSAIRTPLTAGAIMPNGIIASAPPKTARIGAKKWTARLTSMMTIRTNSATSAPMDASARSMNTPTAIGLPTAKPVTTASAQMKIAPMPTRAGKRRHTAMTTLQIRPVMSVTMCAP